MTMVFGALSFVVFAVVSLILESANMLLTWELLLFVLMAIPLYLYAKSNKAWLHFYMGIITLTVASRLAYAPMVASHRTDVYYPLSIDQLPVMQAAGITYFAGMLFYVMVVWAFTAINIHNELKNNEDIDGLNTKSVRINRSLCSTTAVVFVLTTILAVKIYGLQSMVMNNLIFVLIVFALSIAHHVFIKSMITGRKKDLIELQKKRQDKSDLTFIDIG